MSYRDQPETAPLIIALSCSLAAVDPKTGRKRWFRSFKTPVRRFYMLRGRVLAADGGTLHCIELETGAHRGSLELRAEVTAGIVVDERLILAVGGLNAPGAVCVTSEGALVWRIRVQRIGRGSLTDCFLVCCDSTDRELWRERIDRFGDTAGFLFGDLAVQPDLIG